MIQTKQIISYEDRGDKKGIILIDVHSFRTTKDGATFLINDWVIDENGKKTIHSAKEVFRSNEELNNIDEYLVANNDFSNMTKVEIDWKKIKLGLMLDTQSNLLDTGKTIYRQEPSDWEFTNAEDWVHLNE